MEEFPAPCAQLVAPFQTNAFPPRSFPAQPSSNRKSYPCLDWFRVIYLMGFLISAFVLPSLHPSCLEGFSVDFQRNLMTLHISLVPVPLLPGSFSTAFLRAEWSWKGL